MRVNKFVNDEKCQNILSKLVQVDTSHPEGNELNIVKEILSLFPVDEIEHKTIHHGENRGSLVISISGKNNSQSLAFVGHVDTVPAGDESGWMYHPFAGEVKDGYMYGRGTADMKGGVTAMIITALYFLENDIVPPCRLLFCFTADEEADGRGVLSIKESGYLKDVKEIFIPEPSEGKLGLAEKGALWLKIKSKGKSAHASMPDYGLNAIEKLFEFINKFRNKLDLQKTHPLLGRSTVAITNFRGGLKTNVIPETAEATLDIRTIVGFNHEEMINEAETIADLMKQENSNLDIEVSVENNRPAVGISRDNPFITKLEKVFEKLKFSIDIKGLYFYTDASQIIPDLDVPFVILGPGEDAMAHKINERIKISSITKVVKVYINYILSGGGN